MAVTENAYAAAADDPVMNSNGTPSNNKQAESNSEVAYNIIANSG